MVNIEGTRVEVTKLPCWSDRPTYPMFLPRVLHTKNWWEILLRGHLYIPLRKMISWIFFCQGSIHIIQHITDAMYIWPFVGWWKLGILVVSVRIFIFIKNEWIIILARGELYFFSISFFITTMGNGLFGMRENCIFSFGLIKESSFNGSVIFCTNLFFYIWKMSNSS